MILRERIAVATYPEGSFLPGELVLAKVFEVSRITSRRALDELAAEGLVKRIQGSGTMVLGKPAGGWMNITMDSLHSSNKTIGATRAIVLSVSTVTASQNLALMLNVPEDTEIVRIERLRYSGENPYCHVLSFIPTDLSQSIDSEALEITMLVDLLAANGGQITESAQTISATLAWPGIAEKLHVEHGAPLLVLNRIGYDANGRAVEFVDAHFRPDLYTFNLRAGTPVEDVSCLNNC